MMEAQSRCLRELDRAVIATKYVSEQNPAFEKVAARATGGGGEDRYAEHIPIISWTLFFFWWMLFPR